MRMLRQFDDADQVTNIVKAALPKIRQLSDRYDLITLVGYQEGAGHKLVDESTASSLEKELRDEVRGARPSDLAQERDLLRLLFWTNKTAGESDESLFAAPEDPKVYAALLKNSVAEVWSQALGTRAASRKARLHWDALLTVVGNDEKIARMLDQTDGLAINDPELAEAHELARKYLTGWRPPDFGD